MRVLRVGTRRSALATRQTELAIAAMRLQRPEIVFSVVPISTDGDERRDASLREIGGTGVFVKRLEGALLAEEIDLAVHSLKDVPIHLEAGLALVSTPARADPRDALVVRGSGGAGTTVRPSPLHPLPELVHGARVGTGSARRGCQLRALRGDLVIADIRGNVDTRMRKMDEGEYDALVLAAAGLARLQRTDRVARLLEPEEVVPMVGQGALAIEARVDDALACEVARSIEDSETRECIEIERAFLEALGGGCTLPLGALAVRLGSEVRLRAALGDSRGDRVERRDVRASRAAGRDLARATAAELIAALER